jgi:hypothetical protein
VPDTLSYADAVRLLGGEKSRIVTVLDRVAGWAMLAGSPLPDVLGWFDAKAELVRLGHELVREVSERRSGLSRYDRTHRLEAAHAVLAVTAFFEALEEADLPFDLAQLELTKAEQLAVAGARPDDPRSVIQAFFANTAPVPGPHLPYEALRTDLDRYYGLLAGQFLAFTVGLVGWERLSSTAKRTFHILVVDELPAAAVDRHRELLTRLAVDFPEVAFWMGLHEHEATRTAVRALASGLTELRRTLDEISTGRSPDDRRAALARAYGAELGRPIAQSGDVPAGLRVPTLGAAYVPPLCRVAALGSDSRPSSESWWADQPVRDDLADFLTGYLTSPGAPRAPLLVLGQPGSGKSVLTRVLAAQLPAADFMVARVALRDVHAAADLQDQIEQAIRADTGERVEWPALARSAGDALPVVLLDGFDELLQATGVSQTNYLLKVADFQRREADQGRPVAVLVTSRTSVADRAQPPPGTVALRLEPFDDARVARWLATWNELNAAHFPPGVKPLDAATVLAHRELAEQPLLLLMLALYDADGNDLRSAGELRRGELYERLLRSFARREVVKHRPELAPRALDRAVEEELQRLAVVAFAMFNRRAQWVTEAELEADLAGLPFGATPAVADRNELRTPLRAAEIVLGRFFFIHRSQASRDDDRPQAYEFLHATFGEYLVARLTWLVVENMVARESVGSPSLGAAPVDDDLLHSLLSYAVLSARAPVVAFLRERSSTLNDEAREVWTGLLIRLFQAARHSAVARRFDGYRPARFPAPARYAAYSANLLLLAVCAGGTVTGSQLYPGNDDVVAQWHADALLWRSQLAAEEWTNLVNTLALDRRWDGERREIQLSLDDGIFVPPPVDTYWTFNLRRESGLRDGLGITYRWPNQDPAQLRRKAHFECGVNNDTMQHTVEPLAERLPTAVNILSGRWSDQFPSPAHLLLAAWLSPIGDSIEARARLYRRCVAIAEPLKELSAGPAWLEFGRLLLDRLATDPEMPAELAVEVLSGLTGGARVSPALAEPVLRCCLTFLGRDSVEDRSLGELVVQAIHFDSPSRWFWTTEIALEARARLHELGGKTLPIVSQEFESLVAQYGERRPDLIARLRPLVPQR